MQVKILHMRKLHSWKRRNKAFQVYQSLPLSTTQARSHNSRNEDCRPETTSAFCGMAEVPQKKDHLMTFGGIIPKGFMHITHMLHVWYIYLHDWVIFRAVLLVNIPAPWSNHAHKKINRVKSIGNP